MYFRAAKIKFQEKINLLMKKQKQTGVKEYEIPVLGSLGLLALGDVGLKMWREKRDIELAKRKKKSGNSKSKGDE